MLDSHIRYRTPFQYCAALESCDVTRTQPTEFRTLNLKYVTLNNGITAARMSTEISQLGLDTVSARLAMMFVMWEH